jgi:hypothetical protein
MRTDRWDDEVQALALNESIREELSAALRRRRPDSGVTTYHGRLKRLRNVSGAIPNGRGGHRGTL